MRKIQKRYVDYGCGFPVILENVPMVKVHGYWTPDVNYRDLHKAVLHEVINKPGRLTGDEMKFVRLYCQTYPEGTL